MIKTAQREMRTQLLSLVVGMLLWPLLAMAQGLQPTIAPTATYTADDGTEQTEAVVSGSAPLGVTFRANAADVAGWTPHYEWRFYREGMRDQAYLVRYEEETAYTFNEAGTHRVELWATFVQGADTVAYTNEYWMAEGEPLTITISESKLDMPNAFSPNGDGINDVYRAKEGYRSIVEFEAAIFNRWGQKLYSWSDPSGGWDGTFKGKDVAQGVYYVLVKAKGADGRKFNIRRDVNLMRGFTASP